jgi:hypothetical protein
MLAKSSPLALELGRAVDAQRPRRIVGAIGSRRASIEDEVGGDVNQPRAMLAARFRDPTRRLRVESMRRFGVGLRLVDGGVGGGVHDDRWRERLDRLRDRIAVAHVEPTSVAGVQFDRPWGGPDERSTELARGTEQKHLHANVSHVARLAA